MRLKAAVHFARISEICAGLELGAEAARLPSGQVLAVDSPEFSTSHSLTFFSARTPLRLRSAPAALVIAEFPPLRNDCAWIQVASVHEAMDRILRNLTDELQAFVMPPLNPSSSIGENVHPTAVVEGVVAGGAKIGAGCFVGSGSYIGEGTVLEPRATVLENCFIEKGCLIQSGAVIGSAGFGFYPSDSRLVPLPHPAGVVLEEDVWIGANTVVAAGVLHATLIGRGSRLDSHVQVGHNVRLGSGAVMASGAGIAGSTTVGPGLQMGGGSALAGHLTIGSGVRVAAFSAVTKNIPDGMTLAGFPARPIREWRREKINRSGGNDRSGGPEYP